MAEKKCILVVDDDQDTRKTLFHAFENKYCVLTAESVASAWDIVQEEELSVILSDIRMRGENGLDLLNKVMGWDPDLPVILVTGYAGKNVAISAVKGGAFDFLEKPYRMEELRLSIDRALRYRSLLMEKSEYVKKLEMSTVELLKMTIELYRPLSAKSSEDNRAIGIIQNIIFELINDIAGKEAVVEVKILAGVASGNAIPIDTKYSDDEWQRIFSAACEILKTG